MKTPLIFPSILSADFANLGAEIQAVEQAGADGIHFDVMDGHFVPNLSFGAPVLKKIRPLIKTQADCHLMVTEPAHLFKDFADAGADRITIHLEACKDIAASIESINKLGLKVGISIKPKTSVDQLKSLIQSHGTLLDLILIMSVEPGFGGQKFIEGASEKIQDLIKLSKTHTNIQHIQVDGGINKETASTAFTSGANNLVAGSYVFGSNNYKTAIESLRQND